MKARSIGIIGLCVVTFALGLVVGRWFLPVGHEAGAQGERDGRSPAISALPKGGTKIPPAGELPDPEPLPEDAASLAARIDDGGGALSEAELHTACAALDAPALAALVAKLFDEVVLGDAARVAFSQWANKDPRAAWEFASGLDEQGRRGTYLKIALKEIAARSPAEAQRLFQSIRDKPVRNMLVTDLVAALAASDPERALAFAQQLGDDVAGAAQITLGGGALVNWSPSFYSPYNTWSPFSMGYSYMHRASGAVSSVFSTWAERDPAAAAAQAVALESDDRPGAISQVAAVWGRSDPDAALAWAKGLDDEAMRVNAIGTVVGSLANSDPARAAAILEQLPASRQPNYASTIIGPWLQRDLDAALAWIGSQKESQFRTQITAAALPALAQKDPARAVEFFEELAPGQMRRQAMQSVANAWAERDPAGAATWLASMPRGAERDNAAGSVFSRWAADDPVSAAAALELYEGGTGVSNRATTLSSQVAMQWVRQDREAAFAWAEEIPEGKARQSAISTALSFWAGEDPDAAAAYVESLPADGGGSTLRYQALNHVATGYANQPGETGLREWVDGLSDEEAAKTWNNLASNHSHSDAERAQRYFDELVGSVADLGKEYGHTAGTIASRVAAYDADGAIEWLQSLPEGGARDGATSQLVSNLVHADPMSASKVIEMMPRDASRDNAVDSLVGAIQMYDPESAFAWSLDVEDTAQRERLARNSARTWLNQDPDAARAAISGADISPELRAELVGK